MFPSSVHCPRRRRRVQPHASQASHCHRRGQVRSRRRTGPRCVSTALCVCTAHHGRSLHHGGPQPSCVHHRAGSPDPQCRIVVAATPSCSCHGSGRSGSRTARPGSRLLRHPRTPGRAASWCQVRHDTLRRGHVLMSSYSEPCLLAMAASTDVASAVSRTRMPNSTLRFSAE